MDDMNDADTKPPKRKRRWRQFSLRSLLAFITLAAVLLSWLSVEMRRAEREAEASRVLQRPARIVLFDAGMDSGR